MRKKRCRALRQRAEHHTAARRALTGMGFSHHAHILVAPDHPFSGSRPTAAVTATAASAGSRQRPATAHNARTIRANLGYVRPEKRTVVRRRSSAKNLAYALRARVSVAMLREHTARFGVGPDGRIFRSERGNPVNASTWWQVWQKVRAASLTAEQFDGPLMRRPYDLRHAGVTRRLNEGVDEATVAAWAGHSVEVLHRIDHHSTGDQDDVLIARMDAYRRRSYGERRGHTWGTESGTGRHPVATHGSRWHLPDSRRRRCAAA